MGNSGNKIPLFPQWFVVIASVIDVVMLVRDLFS
jgi:hypothetical protein